MMPPQPSPPSEPPKAFPVDEIEDLPLPAPYPEYLPCPHCGEPEVEIWCYENGAPCHACGGWIAHEVSPNCHPPESVIE